MNAQRRRQFGFALALLVAGLLWWWDPAARAPAREPHERSLQVLTGRPDAAVSLPTRPARTSLSPPPLAADVCEERADLDCHDGDVYWFDSCGRPADREEDCQGRGCEDAHCQRPEQARSPCGTVDPAGECSGSVAQACVQGQLVRIDCASRRARCVMTSEGAACLPLDDKLACNPLEPARCEGDQLRLCVDGRLRILDCAARNASCVADGGGAHCEAKPGLPLLGLQPLHGEVCDGRDNDDDGRIDEDGSCETVPLVAFVPQGARLLDLEARMENELQILNRVYAPIQFRWALTREIRTSYRSFDPRNMEAAASELAQSQSRFYQQRHPPLLAASPEAANFDFYVAVLYTEKLEMDPPKSGISTLPNARCGGVRVSDVPSPVSGLIVLSEARQPETLAHEMGHYLGLCHTHEQVDRFAVVSADLPRCERVGDSICDTPDDPGAQSCYRIGPCELRCHADEHPDAYNIMSYYFGCRRVLSAEQQAEVARNLRLRKAWFRCQDPRDCPCDARRRAACPAEMSCHPSGSGDAPWQCELDGPALPGAVCRNAGQCSARGFCVGPAGASYARCVRPCDEEPGCKCQDVGLPVRVCAEDLD
jgi:hypothetical protein